MAQDIHRVQTGFGETVAIRASEALPGAILLNVDGETPVILSRWAARCLAKLLLSTLDKAQQLADEASDT